MRSCPRSGIGDANSRVDTWEGFARAITAKGTPSPHLAWEAGEQDRLHAVVQRELDQPPMLRVLEGRTARSTLAQVMRLQLQAVVPGAADLCDAELLDSDVFPPFSGERPPPAKVHWLGDDEDWTQAPELGFLRASSTRTPTTSAR